MDLAATICTDLPELLTALRDGRLDLAKAEEITRGTSELSRATAPRWLSRQSNTLAATSSPVAGMAGSTGGRHRPGSGATTPEEGAAGAAGMDTA